MIAKTGERTWTRVFGLSLMIAVSVWVLIHGRLSTRAGYIALASIVAFSVASMIYAGAFRNSIILTLGIGVGIAVSSVVTLPLGVIAAKRHGSRTEHDE